MNVSLGRLLIVSAPSGAGKTSLVRSLVHTVPNTVVSVSHTTRAPRVGELEGVDYYFVSPASFETMVHAHAFLEHAHVFDHAYGTAWSPVALHLEAGWDVVFDIDWQGALQIKCKYPEAILVFVIPPSLEILENRLRERSQDSFEIIQKRMLKARSEMEHYIDFDYLILNDSFEHALSQLQAILMTHRLKVSVQKHQLASCLTGLLDG